MYVNRCMLSELTNFDNGEFFDDDDHVREYFTVENFVAMGWHPEDVESQETLDGWCEVVIRGRWHIRGGPDDINRS